MSLGAIPFSRIIGYAKHFGMTIGEADYLARTIMTLDRYYLNAVSKMADKSSK